MICLWIEGSKGVAENITIRKTDSSQPSSFSSLPLYRCLSLERHHTGQQHARHGQHPTK